MPRVSFRFYASLNYFLPPDRQQTRFIHQIKDRASIKDAIESLGVPHPEIDLILVNGESVGFDYLVQEGDSVSVYPRFTGLDVAELSQVQPEPLATYRFVLDVHLGKLASYLRLLGFDVLYRNDYDDEELAEISNREQRILLSQDRGLLKRSAVIHGYAVRSPDPETQVTEVLERFGLHGAIAPLTRCPRCNGPLAPVDKQTVWDDLPHYTRLSYDEFSHCQDCGQIYWKGAHYQRMQGLIGRVGARGEGEPGKSFKF